MSDLLLSDDSSESFSIDFNLSSFSSSSQIQENSSSTINNNNETIEEEIKNEQTINLEKNLKNELEEEINIPCQLSDDRNSSCHYAQRGSSPPRMQEEFENVIYPELVGLYDVKKMIGEGVYTFLILLLPYILIIFLF